jgi:hypothetical protein|tara:strand:- start:87 stop:455 length:369 start_codon:yes stop_codon:yes gene_type:complete
MSTATKRDPKKWAAAKARARAKMGGKHSARAMQLAVKYYKDAGGSYSGPKKSNNKLRKWGRQKWQYAGKKGESRYLPKKAIAALSPSERAATNRKKKADTRAGKQFSKQPKSISNKTRRYRV